MRVLLIDTETGGLDPRVHGLTQVAALDCVLYPDGGRVCLGVRSSFHELVAPMHPLEYEDEALEYQGVTIDELADHGGPVTGVLHRLADFASPVASLGPGRVWAQDDTFDFRFLQAAVAYEAQYGSGDRRLREWMGIRNLDRGLHWDRSPWQCSKRLARLCISLGLLSADSDSLEPVSKAFGLERPSAFGPKPLQDCWLAGQCVAAMLSCLGMASDPYFLER